MTITIGDVSGSFSGYYTTLDYYWNIIKIYLIRF
jgi:hypothetical protein